jgi:hypothetical protein
MAGGVFTLLAAVITPFIPYLRSAPRRAQKVVEEKGMIPTITSLETPITSE